MAVFHVYLDESGKLCNKSANYTALCGYVAHNSEWERFSLEWSNCVFRWQVPPIHMSRIMAPERRSDGWKAKQVEWGKAWEHMRNEMLEEFGALILRSNLVCVGTVIDAVAYRRRKDEPEKPLFYDDSNVFALHEAIVGAIDATLAFRNDTTISVIVDDDPPNAFSYYQHLQTLKEHPDLAFKRVRDKLHALCFGNDKDYPGLQAADMLAYEARVFMEAKLRNQNHEPSGLFFNLTHQGRNQPKLYTAELLNSLGRSLDEG